MRGVTFQSEDLDRCYVQKCFDHYYAWIEFKYGGCLAARYKTEEEAKELIDKIAEVVENNEDGSYIIDPGSPC